MRQHFLHNGPGSGNMTRRNRSSIFIKTTVAFTLVSIVLSMLGACSQNDCDDHTTLHRGLNGDPESLDPHLYVSNQAATILRDMREGLISQDARGNLIPGNAESWQVSQDGIFLTFVLREDLRWSNGDALDATDYQESFRRLLSPKTAAQNAHLFSSIKNAKQILSGEVDVGELGVRALDDRRLQIELEAPAAYFLQLLSHPSSFPVFESSAHSGDVRSLTMVSNGAYKIADRSINSSLTLIRNKNYWNDVGTTIDSVKYHIANQSTEPMRYEAGDLDVTDNISEEHFARLSRSRPKEVHVAPTLGLYYFGLNLTRNPFQDNAKLREALSLSVNRNVIVQKLTGRGEMPAFSIVPPGIEGYSRTALEVEELTQEERNILAKALFADLQYSDSDPLKFELRFNTGGGHKKIAVALQSMWREILGVEVVLREEEFKVFISNIRSMKDTEAYRLSWTADYLDPYAFLQLFETANSSNLTGYSNTNADLLLERSQSELDPKNRFQLLNQAEQLILADFPIIPIYFYVSKHLVNERVSGWEDNLLDIHLSKDLSKAPNSCE